MIDVPSQSLSPARPVGKSLTQIAASLEHPGGGSALSPAAWVKIAVVAALFAAVHFWQFQILFYKWRTDANWSHGFIIPLFSLYLLYARRAEILAAPRKASLAGLAVLLLGLLGCAMGVYPIRNFWFSHASLVVSLLGLVAYLAGWKVLRVVWLPIVYLILAMPLPDNIYDGIALPLQTLAATASGALLRIFGADIRVDALSLEVVGMSGVRYPPLTVAEACSGIRSMMAFVALSVAWAYMADRPWWHRLVLVLAGMPVMVACNILRVSMTATMYVIDKPEFGKELMHELMGVVLLIPALLLLMLLSKFLSSLYVDVEEDEVDEPAASADRSASGGSPEPAGAANGPEGEEKQP
jgi:exosortase